MTDANLRAITRDMDEPQAKAASESASAASTEADNQPQIDVETVTLEQLDELMTTGKAELPLKSDGGKQEENPPATGKVEEPPGAEPKVTEGAPAKVEGEVEETRSAEEIAAAQDEARERVKSEGGDEAAQEAAAEEAGRPVAKVEDPPAKVAEPKKDDDLPERFRFKDSTDRAIVAVHRAAQDRGKPISWAEAEKQVRGEPEEKKIEAQTPALTEVVDALEAEVTDLESKIDAAGEGEGLITKVFTDLTKQLAQKRTDLAMAKRDLKQATDAEQREAQAETERSNTARAESKAAAFERFPDAAVTGSKLDLAIQAEIEALSNPKHPDHALLFADSVPLIVATRVAERLKIAPVTAKAAPPVKTKVEAPPKTKMSPPSGAKTAVKEGELSEEVKAQKQLDHLRSPNATLEELDAVFEPGGASRTLADAVR